MKNRQLHRVIYQLRHRLLTLNNVVIAVAFAIAAGWAWGSLDVMQRNYTLQQAIDQKNQELQLAQLETRSLELQREFHKTREYQEVEIRDRLGLGLPGEKMLILPRQSGASATPTAPAAATASAQPPGNFDQWMDFLFGRRR